MASTLKLWFAGRGQGNLTPRRLNRRKSFASHLKTFGGYMLDEYQKEYLENLNAYFNRANPQTAKEYVHKNRSTRQARKPNNQNESEKSLPTVR